MGEPYGFTCDRCLPKTLKDASILPKAAPNLRAKRPNSVLAQHGVSKAALLRLDCGKCLCFSGGRGPNLPQHLSLLRGSLAPFSSSPAWKQTAPTASCPLLLGMGCQQAARPRLFGALSHHCTHARCGGGGCVCRNPSARGTGSPLGAHSTVFSVNRNVGAKQPWKACSSVVLWHTELAGDQEGLG